MESIGKKKEAGAKERPLFSLSEYPGNSERKKRGKRRDVKILTQGAVAPQEERSQGGKGDPCPMVCPFSFSFVDGKGTKKGTNGTHARES